MRHRGPDSEGTWTSRDAATVLMQTRLAIIDLSASGRQPMALPEVGTCLTYNGEIYNYRELRADLRSEGTTFRSESDSEVLLHLHAQYGHSMLSRLNGIFAFAIHDPRDNSLFLARDQLGTKPLYYVETSLGFFFASEAKALVRGGVVPAEIDRLAALSHMGLLWSPGQRTIFAGIKKLEPGHALIVRAGRIIRQWKYWDFPVGSEYASDHNTRDVVPPKSDTEMALCVARTIRSAVERQLVADVPVGAFLSGGLDSSAVVAFAQEARTRAGMDSVQCFTIQIDEEQGGKEGFAPDLPYAKKVANHLGVDLHIVETNASMMDRLPQMIYHLDEPTADPAAINALLISELARSQGIKVLLSGTGGDDIFTGYRRHFALTQEYLWANLPQAVRGTLSWSAKRLPKNRPLGRRIAKALEYANLDGDERMASYWNWLNPSDAISLFSSDFIGDLKPIDMNATIVNTLRNARPEADAVQRMLYAECKHFLADHNLNYTDKMGMAAGIEVRVPLLDLEVIRLAGALPSRVLQHGRIGKWIFKKAMEPYLPAEIVYRPKTGFGLPLRKWLHTSMHEIVDDVLSEHSLSKRGIFDAKSVRRLLENDRAGRVDASYTLFAVMCMEIWARQFLDGHFPASAFH
jgi:asparagine synthase (glutamine-hydrolysing)